MSNKIITVSKLPNITFYTGLESENDAAAVENRNYDHTSPVLGDLDYILPSYISYWSNFPNIQYSESSVQFYNIGDIISETISYMYKFNKIDSNVDISVDKNVLTINYHYENDLNSIYDNTYIIPARDVINLMQNINDMGFNKKSYYKNRKELNSITYARKQFPYNNENAIYNVNQKDENNNDIIVTYDFSNQFVNYNYTELSYEQSYIRHYQIPMPDGSYMESEMTYTGFDIMYSYQISDIDYFSDRMNKYFEDNSDKLKNNPLQTYYISDLDTRLTLSLNTYSLNIKNLYAYFNFESNYNNWFNNTINVKINTENIENNDIIAKITPAKNDWFNIIINDNDKIFGEDKNITDETNFELIDKSSLENIETLKFVNPANIKELNLSNISNNILEIDLINNYEKKINCLETVTTNWQKENNNYTLTSLVVGNNIESSPITKINGISDLISLNNIDITNCNNLSSIFSINKLSNLKSFKALNSNYNAFVPKSGLTFDTIELPSTLKTLTLKSISLSENGIFNYIPNANLLNMTLENVQGINTQNLVKDWVDSLEETTYPEKPELKYLYSGIINNTNLTGINWQNYKINDLIKLNYVGLNKFSGNIDVIGQNTDYLTRKEYLKLNELFNDKAIITSTNIQNKDNNKMYIKYDLDPNAFIKEFEMVMHIVYTVNNVVVRETDENDGTIYTLNVNDTTGGNSLLDYIETNNSIEFDYDDTKDKWFYSNLNSNIYTGNAILTTSIEYGDIVLYKGNKLIIATESKINLPYKFIKLGKINITNLNLLNRITTHIRLEFK